jgi:hypothetical protein
MGTQDDRAIHMTDCEYKVSGRVVVRHIGQDVLLVPVSGGAAGDGGRVYPINETAEAIWEGVASGKSHESVVGDLVERYDIPKETAEADVGECIQTFVSEGLLERVEH